MTFTDSGSSIVVVLLGLALGAVIVVALVSPRRARYQGPFAEPYASFRTGARTEAGGEFLQLECEGHCPGATAHEVTGDAAATCVLCGTARSVLPDHVAIDDEV